ncbi:hypothetical protein EWF20_00815 [Sulfolobus sp. S-194]|uniref:hypothetical protein n=1 Tax=Sulfolobus sp. S-194 TaxID=2512240 RepID=UPI001436F258|nr:hypothetical protein [Sulfolobus sp. S-194]QIW22843.1 hypothetical protein EWF20_00815 [Sulfolobus sp. S-194]
MSLQKDLFGNYNYWFIDNKAIPIISNVKKEDNIECLNLGPPQSGKSQIAKLIQQHCTPVKESIIGLINLEPVEPNEEHTIASVQQPLIQGNKLDTIVDFFSQHIFPWINTLKETEAIDFNKLTKFSEHELNLLKEYFSEVKRVPRGLTKRLIELREKYGPIIIYYIPWDVNKYVENGEISLDEQVIEAVKLIKKYFNKEKKHLPIKWLGKEYIPPGLVYEIINKASEGGCAKVEGCKVAEEFVKEQAEAYHEVVKFLVGEKDLEFEGILGLSITKLKNSIRDILSNVINTAIIGVMSLTVSIVILTLISASMYVSSERSEHGIADEIIKLKTNWGKLSEPLKKIIEWRVSIQLGVTPSDVEGAINQITGLDEQKIRESVKELEKKLKELENRVDLVESQLKGFKIYKLSDIEKGYLYSNVRLVNDNLGIVSETYGETEVNIIKVSKFNEYLTLLARELEKGFTVINGPKGIGKSTLAVYTIWNLLRNGYYGVIRVEDIIDDNERLKLENFLRDYSDNLKAYFGKLIILYDPSSTESFTSPTVSINVKSVEETVKQLVKLSNKLDKYDTSLLIVIPDDLYNGLSEEVKKSLKNVINIDLKDAEFLKAVIKEYSGCDLGDKLNELSNEVIRFSEGYTLIARLIGEGLRKSNCSIVEIEKILRDAQGNAKAFIINFINNYLRIVDNGTPNVQRIKTLSQIFAIREPFKGTVNLGDYITTPYLVDRLFYWSNLGLNEEEARWISIKHEDLIENAITEIVKSSMGESTNNEQLKKALEYWNKYGKLEYRLNTQRDVINYLFKKYGDNLKKEVLDSLVGESEGEPINPCWNALVFILSSIWAGYSIHTGSETYRKVFNKLMDSVRSAIIFIDDKENINSCNALKLLIVNDDIPPVSKALILVELILESPPVNPIIDALVEGKRKEIKERLKEFEKNVEERKEKGGGIYPVENVYIIGLAILTAYAVRRGIDEFEDKDLWAKVLYNVEIPIQSISNVNLILSIVNRLSIIRNASLNDWAIIYYAATELLKEYSKNLRDLAKFLEELINKWEDLSDLGKTYLMYGIANSLEFIENPCEVFKTIIEFINDIQSVYLKLFAMSKLYYQISSSGLNCDPDIIKALEGFIEIFEELNKIADQHSTALLKSDNQLAKYLRSRHIAKSEEEALKREIKSHLYLIYDAIGNISMIEGSLDKAVYYFAESRKNAKELEEWHNYVSAYGKTVRANILKANNIDELISAASEFEKIYDELDEKLGNDMASEYLRGMILVDYLSYLGISGEVKKANELLMEKGYLLNRLPEPARLLVMIFLNWLNVTKDRPNADEISKSVDVEHMIPVLKAALGANTNCIAECIEVGGKYVTLCTQLCYLLELATIGDKDALEKLAIIFKSENNFTKYNLKAFVQTLACSSSLCFLILILNALANGDYETAKVLIEETEQRSTSSNFSNYYHNLHEAINKNNVRDIKFALSKIYFLHI